MNPAPDLAATIGFWARERAGQVAIIAAGKSGSERSITFCALDELIDSYALGLERSGVRAGDRVLYLLRPTIENYAVFYALLRIHAIPTLIDPRVGVRSLLACIETTEARVLIAEPVFHLLRQLVPHKFSATEVAFTPGAGWWPGLVSLRRCTAGGRLAQVARPADQDEAYMPFTSGSTGAAKGVIYTHGMLRAQLEVIREICGWRDGMRAAMCFAPFTAYALADGLTAILPYMDFSRPAAADPRSVSNAISKHRAQIAFASPVVWRNLLHYCESSRARLDMLEHGVSSGAPVPLDIPGRMRGIMSKDAKFHMPYGATEAMPLTSCDDVVFDEAKAQALSGYGTCVGKPLPGIGIEVIRISDAPMPSWSDEYRVEPGTVGELVACGQVISPAYWQRPQATAEAKIARGGEILHRTGDLGRIDASGRVWFCGRKSHRIDTEKGLIAPTCLENVLDRHQQVSRTAVVGVGSRGAQRVVAFVEMERGNRLSDRIIDELQELAQEAGFGGRIEQFLPHRGFPVDPRHNAKIRRELLADWAARQTGHRQ